MVILLPLINGNINKKIVVKNWNPEMGIRAEG